MPRTWFTVISDVIDRAHLTGGEDLAVIAGQATASLGIELGLYLVDLPQRHLHPLPPHRGDPLPIDSTVAGRAFRLVEIYAVRDRQTGRPTLWVPVLDGAHRVGMLSLALPEDTDADDPELRGSCWTLAGVLGQTVMSKLSQSDLLHRTRRPKPLSVSAELLWQLLPPQTLANANMTVSAVVEYYDEAGGDGYDYDSGEQRGYVAVFDATGHDLQAGLVCSTALAATRHARRGGCELPEIADRADHVVRANTSHSRFATALLMELDFTTGVLTYLNAGHPPPVLLRSGRMAKQLAHGRRLPLGLQHLDTANPSPPPATERLEPGDRLLLYTDGVTEARNDRGEHFGLRRLIDLVERHNAAGFPAPETLRRVAHAVLDHQRGQLHDDATLLLVEWPTPNHPRLLPAERAPVLH
ncbi:PP2C family protein-serine/threonine phosphatase [Saccharomonospora cyanea]|uniref:Stage II sporulation protein E (SpoIIE) n=1 Tax=Saccharomonospora cyanea NA-134 TaxID=882082 RepID=H5XCK9_9PSEU|nr:PP2C family protein-serine/threonine phosphatase [Saccharomonospora cyanea]EHR61255.1 Stage II sporulation protein E (SpoIIE) [Saccharomonospora cyanea NA-134]